MILFLFLVAVGNATDRFIPPFVWDGTVWPHPQEIRQESKYSAIAPNLQFEPGLPKFYGKVSYLLRNRLFRIVDRQSVATLISVSTWIKNM